MPLKLDIKKSSPGDLLMIQKLVVLLKESSYQAFLSHLLDIKAMLPAKLVETIRAKGFGFHSPEELCELIYQKPVSEARTSFHQLSAHTLRLTEYLALNFPSYLMHNLSLIEEMIARQELKRAQFIAEILLDVSVKIDDFTTQIQLLKFLVNQEHMLKQVTKGQYYYDQLKAAQENSNALYDIYYMLRNDFSLVMMPKKKEPEEIAKALDYLRKFYKHPCESISMLSRYVCIYISHYFEAVDQSLDIESEMDILEKEMNNRCYLLMPYLFDIKASFSFIRMGRSDFIFHTKEGAAQINQYRKHYASVGYWQSYLNMPELYILLLKAQQYIKDYSPLIHYKDYPERLPEEMLEEIKETADACLKIIDQYSNVNAYIDDMMNLRMITGALLVLQGGENIMHGINQVEQSIAMFQQVKKSRTIGNSYFVLMMGYFALGDYKQCMTTYARFLKVAKNKDMYEPMDMNIQVYYHAAKWILEKDPAVMLALKDLYAIVCQDEQHLFTRQIMEHINSVFDLDALVMNTA